MHKLLNDESERPSTAVSTDPSDLMEGLDPCGGVGRLKYLLLQIFLIFAFGLGALALPSIPFNYVQSFAWIFLIGWVTCACWVTVQRWKNMGYPWYYLFTVFVPLANLYYSVLLNIGPEGYAIHKKGDRWTKIGLWILFGPFLVMGILAIVLQLLNNVLS